MAAQIVSRVVEAIMQVRNLRTGRNYTEEEAREIVHKVYNRKPVHSTAREGAVSVTVKKGVVD
jgi:NMD protein affecting ribosome stability and mRNA decay